MSIIYDVLFFDVAAFINLVLGTLLSVLTSWLIAHWYFKKKSPAERIGAEIQSDLRRALMPILYPQFYDSSKRLQVSPEQGYPGRDIPYVKEAIFSQKEFPRGGKVEVLLSIRDSSKNLDTETGIKVYDHKRQSVGVIVIGFSFVTFDLLVAANERTGEHKITVELKDDLNNSNVMTFKFNVV
jgi:hypothetical protein